MSYDIKFDDINSIYAKKIFPNKCQLLIEKLPWSFTTSIGVWVKVGSKYDKEDEKGLSHLIEHLLFRGTQNRSAQEIVNYMESVGGEINAFTERELTCFSVKILKGDVQRGIELLYDLVAKPLFNDEDIAKEKEIVKREIEEQEEDYHLRVHDLLIKNMYPNSLGYHIYGDKKNLDNLSKEKIENFYRKFYIPENIAISVTGNFDESLIEDLVKRTFASLPTSHFSPNQLIVPTIKRNLSFFEKDVEQTYFCLGTEGLKQTDPDRVIMFVISSLLGEGMSSRLYKKVREEFGLAYTIYSYYTLYVETGAFLITGITQNGQLKSVLEILKNELYNICNFKVSKEELNMAKAKLQGNFFFNLEQVANRMIRLSKLNDWHGRHYSITEELKMIEIISIDDVVRVADRLFKSDNWNLSIIGRNLEINLKEMFVL
ncbi:M16 family metallopeptidase [Desulfosporosinus metallidurans]|uniref:Peptidase, M16 family n=1 Tax=Desulfosporosinus metallidurans TaxID=1888891 RepID=A0A1Q8QPY6_9FIRM|nr:pitrilysin family protein [Desulfosporosinus metallidurans]OLN29404.1 peptidase, M16 family [Desulfosporosinus metallidurans]